jgi:hypothetical protein
MNEIIERLLAIWVSLSSRERILVSVAGAAIVLATLVLGVVQPILSFANGIDARASAAEQQLEAMTRLRREYDVEQFVKAHGVDPYRILIGCVLSLRTKDEVSFPATDRLFARAADLPEGVERPGLKSIHINRAPVVATPKLLDPQTAERLGIDVQQCRAHRQQLQSMPGLLEKLGGVYGGRDMPPITDPDRMLYSGGFFKGADKNVMDRIRAASPQALRDESFVFDDARLPEMLFRYRARNFPDSLTPEESAQWEEFRFAYLTDPEAGASITMDAYHATIEALQADDSLAPEQQALLQQLLDYGDELLA